MENHIALFYDDKKYLISSLKNFIQIGINAGETAVVIITNDKWKLLQDDLNACGIYTEDLVASNPIRFVDANMFLKLLCPEADLVSEERFVELIESSLGDFIISPCTRWYGEIVSLLCDANLADQAVKLEGYWNNFLNKHGNIFLFCGYSTRTMEKNGSTTSKNMIDICCNHSSTMISSASFKNLIQLKDYAVSRVELALDNEMAFTTATV